MPHEHGAWADNPRARDRLFGLLATAAPAMPGAEYLSAEVLTSLWGEIGKALAAKEGISFADGMRLLAGADIVPAGTAGGADQEWSRVLAGPWLAETLKRMRSPQESDGVDLVITSYGTLLRVPWLSMTSWDLVVLDEAQAIKNPGAKQTRAAKKLTARGRIALTGTPIENRLGDLWSIFDFINPGLLGSAKEFTEYAKRLADKPHNPYGPLRTLVQPYILRRLKTDRTVITDLPAKTEVGGVREKDRRGRSVPGASVHTICLNN